MFYETKIALAIIISGENLFLRKVHHGQSCQGVSLGGQGLLYAALLKTKTRPCKLLNFTIFIKIILHDNLLHESPAGIFMFLIAIAY